MTLLLALALASQHATPVIRVDTSAVVRRFDPRTAFGAGVDGHERGDAELMLSPENVLAMKSMGLRSLSYRLRTELAGEVWHWNPEGTWSDPSHQQGYWVSSATSRNPIWLSYGYRLPRRGNSLDQANRDSYSRIDDGDPATYWKSNPYLDPAFTGESYAKNPQWVVIEFAERQTINELRIDWARPYATRYTIEYLDEDDDADWTWASPDTISHRDAGPYRDRFKPFKTRYVKVSFLASSGTALRGSSDRRDRLGFAVREISAGFTDLAGAFHDAVVHAADNTVQSLVYVSSTDPWHRAKDLDRKTEQPGFDMILERGLDQGEGILMSTGCLYDNPPNVANEVAWLLQRGVKLRGVELGEEPDGNWVYADQYALLYLEMANAVRKVAPLVRLGGPSLQTAAEDYTEFPRPGAPWLTRFVEFLRLRGRLKDFAFCSFEWYPFDNVKVDPARDVLRTAPDLAKSISRLRGLAGKSLPFFITEFGWSAYAAPVEVSAPGALFDFDTALTALSLGCETSYQYGWEPNDPIQEVRGVWGNNMALLAHEDAPIKLPTYWSAWLLTQHFCAVSGVHSLLRTSGGNTVIGAYAVKRPDGTIALALLNRSPVVRSVSVASGSAALRGWTYGSPQFSWATVRKNSTPERSLAPAAVTVNSSGIALAPYSITVLEFGEWELGVGNWELDDLAAVYFAPFGKKP